MTLATLFEKIKEKKSYLCIGLDPAMHKIPKHLLQYDDPIFEFNKQIIDATLPYCVAYKPNVAFYEALGTKGWETLEKTFNYLPQEIFTIADAKRGDIGNTSACYAQAFFEHMNVDAITVAPYMGKDTVKPFLTYENKWVILLALTSNASSKDFQTLYLKDSNEQLFERVVKESLLWATPDQLMFVVGATQAKMLTKIRAMIPQHFLLIPGVGTQGGSLEAVSQLGMNQQCGLLVNVSRSIIYASKDKDFASQAAAAAKKVQQEMKKFLDILL